MYRLKRNKLILAFPGMGKTPLALKRANYRDVDFGTYRTGRDVAKKNETSILPEFARYLSALDSDWERCTIMTNEPKLQDYVLFDKMYLPQGERALSHCAKKMGVSVEQVTDWVEDWANTAKRHGTPIVYVANGLDNYLLDNKSKPRRYMLPVVKR